MQRAIKFMLVFLTELWSVRRSNVQARGYDDGSLGAKVSWSCCVANYCCTWVTWHQAISERARTDFMLRELECN